MVIMVLLFIMFILVIMANLGRHVYLIEQAIQQWMANGGVENLIMQVW